MLLGAFEEAKGEEIGVSLKTPDKVRRLQRKLYVKAKEEPEFRFYLLYDKVHREDILEFAYRSARSNRGAAGVDGMTFGDIETQGPKEWLAGLGKELREETYKPDAVHRVMIPKPGGGERPLGIPTIRDRVVQTAAKLVLEPIFETDFEPCAHGYRPRRSAKGAVEEVHRVLRAGYTDVVDADLSGYFDTIPHPELMRCVARRVVDRRMLRLVKLFLSAPVQEQGYATRKSDQPPGTGPPLRDIESRSAPPSPARARPGDDPRFPHPRGAAYAYGAQLNSVCLGSSSGSSSTRSMSSSGSGSGGGLAGVMASGASCSASQRRIPAATSALWISATRR